MKVETFQYQGRRNYQQDSFYVNENLGVFIVCDGVGGSKNGGKASELVVDALQNYLSKVHERDMVTALKGAVRAAHIELITYKKLNPEFSNSGTTIAILVIENGTGYTAHMGDSRVILLKKDAHKYWQTKDHSMVQELLDAGVLKNEDDIYTHPLKNRITNGLFANRTTDLLNITINELNNISQGDIFIICSDGVFESYLPKELYQLYNSYSITEATDIVSQKVESKSKDNSTCIIVEV